MEELKIIPTKITVRNSDDVLLLELEEDKNRGLEITYINIYINTEEDIDRFANILKKALSLYTKEKYEN